MNTVSFRRLTPEELAARSRRNIWIALALVGFIVLLFATTTLRMFQNQETARAAREAAAASTAIPVAPVSNARPPVSGEVRP